MRMWMVNPKIMCNKHLLGEHVECHMFAGAIRKGKSLIGFINNNLFEPKSLLKRHNDLVIEMTRRGMNHKSSLTETDVTGIEKYSSDIVVDSNKSLLDLLTRCEECRKRKPGD